MPITYNYTLDQQLDTKGCAHDFVISCLLGPKVCILKTCARPSLFGSVSMGHGINNLNINGSLYNWNCIHIQIYPWVDKH